MKLLLILFVQPGFQSLPDNQFLVDLTVQGKNLCEISGVTGHVVLTNVLKRCRCVVIRTNSVMNI